VNILVITRRSWSNNNNIGNTMTNLFMNLHGSEIHNLYFRSEKPQNNICKTIFQISEQQLIRNIFSHKPTGRDIYANTFNPDEIAKEETLYSQSKKNNLRLLWFIRELVWDCGNWKTKALIHYLHEINIDIVFMPVFGCYYPHKVLKFIKEQTNAKIVLFHADDNYSLKQFSFSPLYWLYRFGLRRWVRRSVKMATINYCISRIQITEYQKAFKKPCKLLYKGIEQRQFTGYSENERLKLVFTGNISSGRWKTLAIIGRGLQKMNKTSAIAQLIIYTATPMTKKMKQALLMDDTIKMMGQVPAASIPIIQNDADILIHVESFALKDKLEVRMSFSTKIVDYLEHGKCIFAVGPIDVASIDYLKKNDAAVIATSDNDAIEKLSMIIRNPELRLEYAEKAWKCGQKNHNRTVIQERFYNDLADLVS